MNTYHRIAFAYDLAKKVVFGRRLERMALANVDRLKPDTQILIVGGGTGWILEGLPAAVSVNFVEPARGMMARAKKRKTKARVTYNQAAFDTFQAEHSYDYIMCNFFLDLFPETELTSVTDKMKELLKPQGELLVTDFNNSTHMVWYNRLLLKTIIAVFRLLTAYPNKDVPNIAEAVQRCGFKQIDSVEEVNGLLFRAVFSPSSEGLSAATDVPPS